MKLYSNHYTHNNIINDTKDILQNIFSKKPTILCIGSNKIILDCLGPLVGTLLKDKTNLNIIGDLSNPITAKNLHTIISSIENKTVIVIDCCIGQTISDTNIISIYKNKALPGGLHKNKHSIGNYKILACVDHLSNPLIYNNSTSLSHVYNLATTITNIIINALEE